MTRRSPGRALVLRSRDSPLSRRGSIHGSGSLAYGGFDRLSSASAAATCSNGAETTYMCGGLDRPRDHQDGTSAIVPRRRLRQRHHRHRDQRRAPAPRASSPSRSLIGSRPPVKANSSGSVAP